MEWWVRGEIEGGGWRVAKRLYVRRVERVVFVSRGEYGEYVVYGVWIEGECDV